TSPSKAAIPLSYANAVPQLRASAASASVARRKPPLGGVCVGTIALCARRRCRDWIDARPPRSAVQAAVNALAAGSGPATPDSVRYIPATLWTSSGIASSGRSVMPSRYGGVRKAQPITPPFSSTVAQYGGSGKCGALTDAKRAVCSVIAFSISACSSHGSARARNARASGCRRIRIIFGLPPLRPRQARRSAYPLCTRVQRRAAAHELGDDPFLAARRRPAGVHHAVVRRAVRQRVRKVEAF